ncbi:MAG: MCE family protein [Flavobacteriaceae bacterium]|nr:MCE family protein [Flavobacteriaceae bacterium]
MKLSKEFKTGFFAIAIIALSIWGFNFLKGRNIFDGGVRTFKAEYKNVEGLTKASPVTINGVTVGKVTDIQFSKEKRGSIIVEFSVENDFEFSKNSVAEIYNTSLMGGKSVAILTSFDGETAESGDFIKGEVETDIFSSVSEKINPLQAKVGSLIKNIDSVMININGILDTKTKKNLKSSIQNLNSAIKQVNYTAYHFNGLVKNNKELINKSLKNTEEMTKNFAKVSNDLAKKDLSKTISKLETTISDINSLVTGMKNGKGTLGKLMTDEKAYTNLTNATKELEELLRDIKLHPKRFVHFSIFGKKNKEYKTDK